MSIKNRLLGSASVLALAGGLLVAAAPAAHAAPTPAGSCSGSTSLGKLTPGLTDTPQAVTVAVASLKSAFGPSKGTPLTGTCTLGVVPNIPVTKVSSKLTSPGASCASASTPGENTTGSYPLNGKLTFKEAGPGGQIAAYVSILGFSPTAQDVVDVGGIVTKGDLVGAQVGGSLWEDPAVKDTVGDQAGAFPGEDGTNVAPKVAPTFDGLNNSGYSLDIAGLFALAGCADGLPGSVTGGITQVLVGDGASVLKQAMGVPAIQGALNATKPGCHASLPFDATICPGFALSIEGNASGVSFSFGE